MLSQETGEAVLLPAECTTMPQVRAGVDALDRQLVALLAVRYGYMDAAARIKPERAMVRDEARKTQVLDNVEHHAAGLGLPAADLRRIWDELVESSIAHEMTEWDRRRA